MVYQWEGKDERKYDIFIINIYINQNYCGAACGSEGVFA